MATTGPRELVALTASRIRTSTKTARRVVDETVLIQAEKFIEGCQHCTWTPELTLDYLLDSLMECDEVAMEYVLCRPAKCGGCGHDVSPKTAVLVT